MNTRTDSELLRDYAGNGSETAFAELVSRHLGLVYSAALRVVVDPHLAEDATQTTFTALARQARYLLARQALASWLHRTATHHAAKLVRGEMRRRAREQQAYAMENVSTEPAPNWQQLAPRLDAALNRLPEADRMAIFLRFFEKKTALEISAVLHVGEEAAQKRVQRALERLRKTLASDGLPLPTTTLAALVTAQAIIVVPATLSASVSTAALASAAAATGLTFATVKLLFMSKLKVTAVSALVIAGVATPLVLQHQHLARLRDQNQHLRQQIAHTDILRLQNVELSRQLDQARRNQSLSQAQFSELLRLRGEVGPLRRDSQELARLRTRQGAEPGAPSAGPGFVPATAWANLGLDQPESAIQTFLWAARQGETNLVGNLLRWQRDTDIPASLELDQKFAKAMVSGTTRLAGGLQGFRVTSRQEATTNEVRLGLEMTNADGRPEAHTLRLVEENGQWFPVMHVWLQDQGTIQAAMDIPAKFQPTP